MGKKGDPKVPILPSTTRKGTVLSTSATLDSPAVISKFASPLPPHATSTESFTMSDTFDDASTTLDDDNFLGHYIETETPKDAARPETEIPATNIPTCPSFGYPDLDELKERLLDDDYVILDDDLSRELRECADSDPGAIRELLKKHSMKNKNIHDPKFSTSPICTTDPDYEFSVDLSLISTVESDPFYGRENDDAIAHLTKLAELTDLFNIDEKIRNFYVAKLFPFSLKEDAKSWYDALPYGSIKSPQDLVKFFVDKYFPAHMQHAALQRIYNFKQLQDEHLPKAWGRFCDLLKVMPGHGVPKNELLDIFYDVL